MMTLIVGFTLWILGGALAMAGCSTIGLVFSILIALSRSAFKQLLFYSFAASICFGFSYGIWTFANYISGGELFMLWGGLAFPGILALPILPQFFSIAIQQTNGDVK